MWSRISNDGAGIACSVWRTNLSIVSIGISGLMKGTKRPPMNIRHMLQLFNRVGFLASALMLLATFALTGCSHKQADADRLVAMLQIKPGMVVADVGAGSGWMTVIMAGLVGPKGHVFATEIDPRELGKIRSAVAAAHLDNVTVIQS